MIETFIDRCAFSAKKGKNFFDQKFERFFDSKPPRFESSVKNVLPQRKGKFLAFRITRQKLRFSRTLHEYKRHFHDFELQQVREFS